MGDFKKAIIGGIFATAVMSLLIIVSPFLGFQRISVWEIIANVIKAPIIFGWVIHFLIGIFFALIYAFLLRKKIFGKIKIPAIKGMFFGFLIFIFAQIFAFLRSGLNLELLLGSFIGHIIYGFILGVIVR